MVNVDQKTGKYLLTLKWLRQQHKLTTALKYSVQYQEYDVVSQVSIDVCVPMLALRLDKMYTVIAGT